MICVYSQDLVLNLSGKNTPPGQTIRCAIHDQEYTYFSRITGMFLCETCLEKINPTDNVIKITDFDSLPDVKSEEDLEKVRNSARNMLEAFKKSMYHYKTAYELDVANKTELETKYTNFKELVNDDIESFGALLTKLKELSGRSTGHCLKSQIAKILKMKLSQKQFSSERTSTKTYLEEIEQELLENREMFNWYHQKVLVLETVARPIEPTSHFEVGSIFVVKNKDLYLKEPFCINTRINTFRAFTGVNLLNEIDEVYKKELHPVAQGIEMSDPVPFKMLKSAGTRIFASVSHKGIFVSNPVVSGELSLEFVDLLADKTVSFPVSTWTTAGFYDDRALIISEGANLLDGSVDDIFSKKSLSTFKSLKSTPKVSEYTDVSLLHSTRLLIYASFRECITCVYNVDTKKLAKINTDREAFEYASVTGIKTGHRGILKECGNSHNTCALNIDNSTTCLLEHNQNYLCVVLPSLSTPEDLSKAVKLYSDSSFFMEGTKAHKFKGTIEFRCNVSIVRLYSDVFLMFDKSKDEWVVARIVVP